MIDVIKIQYSKKNYLVDNRIYSLNRALLPDNTLINIVWGERLPPAPIEITEVPYSITGNFTMEAKANMLNAVLAQDAPPEVTDAPNTE